MKKFRATLHCCYIIHAKFTFILYLEQVVIQKYLFHNWIAQETSDQCNFPFFRQLYHRFLLYYDDPEIYYVMHIAHSIFFNHVFRFIIYNSELRKGLKKSNEIFKVRATGLLGVLIVVSDNRIGGWLHIMFENFPLVLLTYPFLFRK